MHTDNLLYFFDVYIYTEREREIESNSSYFLFAGENIIKTLKPLINYLYQKEKMAL